MEGNRNRSGGGAAEVIRHAIVPTALGKVLIAASSRGICRVAFAEGADSLAAHYPGARVEAGADDAFAAWVAAVVAVVEGRGDGADVPLDLRGTAFQQNVWAALRAIPSGETRSYAQVAAAIGQPDAARAVGTANGANPVAVLVPCHRVLRGDGAMGGYHWGVEIKRALLRREGVAV
ncbi:methylated-DNA--[protein]-cysteine S-methyltransferase [Novosphingobium sp. FSY-8]|uniref:Methylated-DNA--[protein]-cysteine S-methyltransferase n=1 Tax=Novosphingobium ovatum TaxID=1908523 RepID=A0ABW9XB51_9SPHN|nr:methylated-DNA--[protein]-cysteine S-methyltransferase [Novosphingobium ovatum]NBC35732.1 methylated-DNA--[protein]-cysteine S-methyltransferase [Novosphingobium ovatum]